MHGMCAVRRGSMCGVLRAQGRSDSHSRAHPPPAASRPDTITRLTPPAVHVILVPCLLCNCVCELRLRGPAGTCSPVVPSRVCHRCTPHDHCASVRSQAYWAVQCIRGGKKAWQPGHPWARAGIASSASIQIQGAHCTIQKRQEGRDITQLMRVGSTNEWMEVGQPRSRGTEVHQSRSQQNQMTMSLSLELLYSN